MWGSINWIVEGMNMFASGAFQVRVCCSTPTCFDVLQATAALQRDVYHVVCSCAAVSHVSSSVKGFYLELLLAIWGAFTLLHLTIIGHYWQ